MKIPTFSEIFRRFERRNTDPFKAWLQGLAAGRMSSANIPVSADTALKVAAVFACIDVISSTIAYLPCTLYKKTAEGRRKAEGHPIFELLSLLPNPETTAFEFWEMFMVNLLLCKEAFAVIKRDPASGFITGLYNVPSNAGERESQLEDRRTLLPGLGQRNPIERDLLP